MEEVLKVQLRAVLYQEDGEWVAHCLEMDVCGVGPDPETAFSEMADAVSTQVDESVERHNCDNIFMPADSKYLRMFFAAKHRAVGHLKFYKPTKLDGITIEKFDAREYGDNFALTV